MWDPGFEARHISNAREHCSYALCQSSCSVHCCNVGTVVRDISSLERVKMLENHHSLRLCDYSISFM